MDELGTNTNKFNKEKSMKIIKIIIAFIVLLFIAGIGITVYMVYLQKKEFKIYKDGKIVSSYPQDLIVVQDDKMYFSIKDFAKLVDYTPNNGEYKGYSEDMASCYVQNNNEAATYTLNSAKMYKNVTSEKVGEIDKDSIDENFKLNREYFQLEEPVKQINDKLYTTVQGASIGCNAYINYDQESNSLKIYTLSELGKTYTNQVKNAAITGEKALFSNKKGVLYDLVVVQDPTTELFGVSNTKNEEVIGKKYKEIKFVESTQSFIVKTTEEKVGIIAKDGTTKIKPEFDSISQIDNSREYYIVKNKDKYGVINKNGKTIIFLEFDKIGIDTTRFKTLSLDNDFILYNNIVPVEKGDKWGLMDLNGNKIVDTIYDELGCVETASRDKAVENSLLIPEYEGIVVCKDDKYGLINAVGKELIPTLVTDFYNITSAGKTSYYLTYNEQTLDVLDYLQNTLKIPPVEKKAPVTNNDVNTTTDNNTTTNTTAGTETNTATSTVAEPTTTGTTTQQPATVQPTTTGTTTTQPAQSTSNPQ